MFSKNGYFKHQQVCDVESKITNMLNEFALI